MFIYIILLSLNLGMFLILLILLEQRCRGISDLSQHRLKYQFGKNLRRRPTSAEYELHKNLRVGWDYQLHKPLLSIMWNIEPPRIITAVTSSQLGRALPKCNTTASSSVQRGISRGKVGETEGKLRRNAST